MTQEAALVLAQQRVIAEQTAELARIRETQCVYCRDLPTFRDDAIFLGEHQLTRDGLLNNRTHVFTMTDDPRMTFLSGLDGGGQCRINEGKGKMEDSTFSMMGMHLHLLHPSFPYPMSTMTLCPHSLPVWLAVFQEIHNHYNPPSA